MISVKENVVFVLVICSACGVVMCGVEVTLVNRNVTDSFLIGEDGCTNDTSICTNHSATCQQNSGLCLCSDGSPNFRNPSINASGGSLKYGESYGCVSSIDIRLGDNATACPFAPFQVIPYNQHDPVKQFTYKPLRGETEKIQSCSLQDAWAKFPDNFTEMKLQGLNESYINLTILKNVTCFKWRRSVPELQGTIVTFNLSCNLTSQSHINKCLRAKILGTWSADKNPTSNPQTQSFTHPQNKTNTPTQNKTSSNFSTTQSSTTDPRLSTPSATSSGDDDDSDMTIIIIAVVVPVVLLIVLIVIIWLLCRRKKGQRNSSRGSSRKKIVNSAASSSLKEFRRTDSNLRGPDAYIDAPEKDTTQTFTGPAAETVKSHTNAGYSSPDIKRTEINGDIYALLDKKKSNKKSKDDNGLRYMDPSASAPDKQENDKASDDTATSQPNEYANIVGFMKPTPDK